MTDDGAAGARPAAAPWPAPRPTAAHWWSILPPPAVRAITARRAYAEVLVVFAVFFAASVVAGGETLAGRYPPQTGSWATFTPAAISELGTSVLAVLVVVLLSARRGITPRLLGLGWAMGREGARPWAQALRTGVWAIVALLAGGAVTVSLAMGHELGQPGHQDASYVLYTMAASLTAGVVEEMVVLAFVVTTLRQAARPLPEIVLVAVLLRCSYHDYYGPGVIGIAIWATVFVWLFLRTGSVLPLIVVHVLWDANIFLGQHWHGVQMASAAAFGLLFLAAVSTWLAEAMTRRARGTAPPVPHGAPGGGDPVGRVRPP